MFICNLSVFIIMSDSPKHFLSYLHPISGRGDVLLSRFINKTDRPAKVSISELNSYAGSDTLWGANNLKISISRYIGQGIILNFIESDIFYLRLSIPPKSGIDNMDMLLDTFRWGLEKDGIPFPSCVLNTGKNLIPIWVSDTPFDKSELHLWKQTQDLLLKTFKHLTTDNKISINSFLPVPGTFSRETQKHVRLEKSLNCKTIDFYRLQNTLIKKHNPSLIGYNSQKLNLAILMDLYSLFQNRLFDLHNQPHHYQSWVYFFSIYLEPFCTTDELNFEINQVCNSLRITSQKTKSFCKNALSWLTNSQKQGDNLIYYENNWYELNSRGWRDKIISSLGVSDKEIYELNFGALGQTSKNIHINTPSTTHAIGDSKFNTIGQITLQSVV